MGDELLLVGSIPLDTPQEVFQTFGAPLSLRFAKVCYAPESGLAMLTVSFVGPDPSLPSAVEIAVMHHTTRNQ